jgi:hypothetical protein
MVENDGTDAHPAPSSLCVGLRRGVVGQCFVFNRFLNIITSTELKTNTELFRDLFTQATTDFQRLQRYEFLNSLYFL